MGAVWIVTVPDVSPRISIGPPKILFPLAMFREYALVIVLFVPAIGVPSISRVEDAFVVLVVNELIVGLPKKIMLDSLVLPDVWSVYGNPCLVLPSNRYPVMLDVEYPANPNVMFLTLVTVPVSFASKVSVVVIPPCA